MAAGDTVIGTSPMLGACLGSVFGPQSSGRLQRHSWHLQRGHPASQLTPARLLVQLSTALGLPLPKLQLKMPLASSSPCSGVSCRTSRDHSSPAMPLSLDPPSLLGPAASLIEDPEGTEDIHDLQVSAPETLLWNTLEPKYTRGL